MKDEINWKELALFLAERHIDTAENEAQLAKASKSFKDRQMWVCRIAHNVIDRNIRSTGYRVDTPEKVSERCQKAMRELGESLKD